ncbi:dual specificity protein phosphatase 3 isoform X1 [Tetranychus urticae]|uniref:Dual specificity protein phosphatase n=1 Tax=Tetranychus urticae TaxID=32264 RepID=T1JXS7_TETUR|nr:dual specificity protein phosphatase 3 isoform X1 [Tetranychus urticae]XP_015795341.1 dual specificity protein phosphatase 3 isoform X1 [Tetranychus urticae]XP_015795342.1 dual specificity protein phosphatase 3 isoform X1 [Tetranychus urticae]XP_015795343.1 dual specificity protein phosphatase 3 isoform X1 [Tetranychus urticae]XP_025018512.1 dual specificity protein phosphatase 3 isoform X1 [Tetranychus urticae]
MSSLSWWKVSTPSCSPDELSDIITAPNGGYYTVPTDPYNEVFPNIYVGDGTTALCTSLLRRLGITHVLNAAWGKSRSLNLVNTNESFYRDAGIEFMGIEALDMSTFLLSPHFEAAADFIDKAIITGGKVYVHCRQGISRSATLVLAYLMIKRDFTVQEAVRTVRRERDIIPNEGFLKQLCLLNETLLLDRRLAKKSESKMVRSANSKPVNAITVN